MASRNARVNARRRMSTYRKPTGKKAGIWTVRKRIEKKCPHPEKKAYESLGVAGRALSKIKEHGADSNIHAYLCRCQYWHLGHNKYAKAA